MEKQRFLDLHQTAVFQRADRAIVAEGLDDGFDENPIFEQPYGLLRTEPAIVVHPPPIMNQNQFKSPLFFAGTLRLLPKFAKTNDQ